MVRFSFNQVCVYFKEEKSLFLDDGVMNVRSLHGNTSFHMMGRIKVATPPPDQPLDSHELLNI